MALPMVYIQITKRYKLVSLVRTAQMRYLLRSVFIKLKFQQEIKYCICLVLRYS